MLFSIRLGTIKLEGVIIVKKPCTLALIALLMLSSFAYSPCLADSDKNSEEQQIDSTKKNNEADKDDHLVVLWTSGDKEVAIKMVFMYVFNAKKYEWWKDITFIVWGPSSKLTADDPEIQEYIKNMLDEGIVIKACKACADLYGVSDTLASLGIEVKYMGTDLTDYIKSGTHLITF